jgi:two-component system chemotaxis response regulator CheB
MLRVLIADDSALVRETLATLINEDPEMMVAGVAVGGGEVVRKAGEIKPDLITMDLLMPDMDGVEATRRIMTKHPVPIVLVSSTVSSALTPTHFDALAVGAVDVVEKPDIALLTGDRRVRRKFVENLKAMSTVVTVTRRGGRDGRPTSRPPSKPPLRTPSAPEPLRGFPQTASVIVAGASTGGPPALARALRFLQPESPPVVVVQHMTTGFIGGYADWLGRQIGSRVRLAENSERLSPGVVYLAPDERHVELTPYGRLLVYSGLPLRYHRPSVDVLFQSAARSCAKKTIALLLTGMGDDGARGLAALREAGAYTVAQDKQSSVVYGMPAAATERGAARWTADCDAIAEALRGVRFELGSATTGAS